MADVMQTMQKQKGEDNMPMLDILKKDVEASGGDFDSVYAALKQGIDSGKMRILRSVSFFIVVVRKFIWLF
jgi:hypothetical protein